MQFDPVLLALRLRAMKEAGFGVTKPSMFMSSARQKLPGQARHRRLWCRPGSAIRLSYRDLDQQVDRIARGLVALGVGRQDVVTWQLAQSLGIHRPGVICARIGAVANPVMPDFSPA